MTNSVIKEEFVKDIIGDNGNDNILRNMKEHFHKYRSAHYGVTFDDMNKYKPT